MKLELAPRQLGLADKSALLALRARAAQEERLGPRSDREENASPEAVQRLLESDAVTLGAFDADRLLGECTISYYPALPYDVQDICGLSGLYVPKGPGEKGHRIGELLVRSCLEHETMQSAVICLLEVYSPRTGLPSTARDLYLRLGFEDTEVIDPGARAPGMLKYQMKLDLHRKHAAIPC